MYLMSSEEMYKMKGIYLQLLLGSCLGLVVSSQSSNEELYQANCRESLGMHSGQIPDSAIKASSSYDEESVGPQNARIRTERKGGAWCPKNQITSSVYEWLQVDLGELRQITLVETQGRFGNGQGQEFAEHFKLEYQRSEEGKWIPFRNRAGKEIFQGNSNTYIAELREINPPIVARRIRFVPYSSHPRTVCMRVELYGCDWKDGIVAYSIPQGDRRGAEVDLYDFTYDGSIRDNWLSGGLGLLVDDEEGHTNFRLDPQNVGKKGYGWVGWKNDSSPPVELIFSFDSVRNFSSVRLHCNNMFSKEVRVFRMAKIYFSIGGRYFLGEPVVYEYMRDTLMEFARTVIIAIPHRIGQYVKIQLFFDARWIMASEVRFESDIAVGNFTIEEAPPTHLVPSDEGSRNYGPITHDKGYDNPVRKNYDKKTESEVGTKSQGLDDQYIGIIIGAMAALLVLLFVVIFIIIVRNRRRKHAQSQRVKASFEHITLNLNDLRTPVANGKVLNGNMYSSVATSEGDVDGESSHKISNGETVYNGTDSIQTRKLPELPKTPESTDTNLSTEYAVPDLTKSSLIVNKPSFTPNIYPDEVPPPVPPHPVSVYTGPGDTMGFPNLQGVSGNNVYAVPNAELLWKEELSVVEFPRENLRLLEKLGEGQFGEVHLCEATGLVEYIGDDFLINRTGSRSLRVAVKMLHRNADKYARDDFQKEVRIMSKLKDPNIVRVMGVCTQEEPLCVVVEYMKYGDLNQFLRNHLPEGSTLARKKSSKTLSYGCLIYMANQVASGMKYLESLNMVHRDLATRNCLVGNLYTIKISDFGMSRSLYSADYYRIEGKAVLPIRWMAWESVLLGKFSSKSDVWSFAVTLWEVLTFAREQPFDNLTDDMVIENCGHYYRNDRQEHYLNQPSNCPKEIFDLMMECWNREEANRPAFREIHMFLQRKNMGYDPRDERQTYSNTSTRDREKITVPVV